MGKKKKKKQKSKKKNKKYHGDDEFCDDDDDDYYCGKSAKASQAKRRFARKGLCGLNMDEDDKDLCDQIKSDYCGEGRTDVRDTMRNFCRYIGFNDVALHGAVETARVRQAVSREVAEMYDMVVDDIEDELEDEEDSSDNSSEDSSEDSSKDSSESSEDSSESSEDSSEDESSED